MTRTAIIKHLDGIWRKQVLGGSFTCEVCDMSTTGPLDAHHYIKRTNLSLRFNIRNGIRLDRLCHTRAEKDPKWFAEEFKRIRPIDKHYDDEVAREPIRPWKDWELLDKLKEIR